MRHVNRGHSIDTQVCLSGQAVQENFNYKRVNLGRVCGVAGKPLFGKV